MTKPTLTVAALFFAVASSCSCKAPGLKDVHVSDAGCESRQDCPISCTASAEVCDGVDNDCDGLVDEDLEALTCGKGACQHTVPSCLEGQAQTCTPLTASAEICDGLDNDCDGLTDDGLLPASCGVGECVVVTSSCSAGKPNTCHPAAPQTEVCDGKDNNCDGTVDEDLLTNISSDLRITQDDSSSDYVYAGWTGSRFGIAWQDKRDGAAQKGEIYFVPLDANGQRMRSTDVRVTQSTGISTHPTVEYDGNQFALVYADDTGGQLELFMQKLLEDGSLTGPAKPLTNSSSNADWPDLVFTGSGYGLTWEDDRNGASPDIYFALFDMNGEKTSADVRVTSSTAKHNAPILKFNGTDFALVYVENKSNNRDIIFQRISAKGQLLGLPLHVTQDPSDAAWPDLTWNGTEWAVVWHDNRSGDYEVYFARISALGAKVGSDVRLTQANGFSGYASIDWNGFQYGLSWQDDRGAPGRTSIYFTAVSALGVKTGSDKKLSQGTGIASYTTALWNGSTFAFAWKDDRDGPSGNTEVYFAYVGCP